MKIKRIISLAIAAVLSVTALVGVLQHQTLLHHQMKEQ